MCKPSTFEDGLNITNNAEYACLNSESIVIKIVVRGDKSAVFARDGFESLARLVSDWTKPLLPAQGNGRFDEGESHDRTHS